MLGIVGSKRYRKYSHCARITLLLTGKPDCDLKAVGMIV